MKNIQYLDILKEALSITWKNKFLWFFGFLLFIGSIGANFKFNDSNINNQESKVFSDFVQNNPKSFVILGILLILILIALFVFRILATVGIIKSVNDINLYRQLSIVAILKQAREYFWRLLLLELIVGFLIVVIALLLATPVIYLFTLNAKTFAFCAMTIAIIIFIPLVILALYLIKYATFYIILINEKIRFSLESAYAVFVKNIKESLIMGIVVIFSSLALIAGMLCLLLLLTIIFIPLGFVSFLIFAKIGAMIILAIAILVVLIFLLAMVSWYEAFLQTVWLLFFKQITFEKHNEKKVSAKIEIEGEIPNPEVV